MIRLYTTTSCPHCIVVRERLRAAGIGYVQRNIDADPDALAEFALLPGSRTTVPALVISTKEVYWGGDEILRWLAEKKFQKST